MRRKKLRDPRVTFRALSEHIRGVCTAMTITEPAQVIVFYAIAADPGRHTVGDIAKLCDMNLKTASRVLRTLRQIDWIELRGDPHDTRKRRVCLTLKGDGLARLINGSATDMAFRIVENVMGKHPSNPNLSLRPKKSSRRRR